MSAFFLLSAALGFLLLPWLYLQGLKGECPRCRTNRDMLRGYYYVCRRCGFTTKP